MISMRGTTLSNWKESLLGSQILLHTASGFTVLTRCKLYKRVEGSRVLCFAKGSPRVEVYRLWWTIDWAGRSVDRAAGRISHQIKKMWSP
jgi:hypothetical protein